MGLAPTQPTSSPAPPGCSRCQWRCCGVSQMDQTSSLWDSFQGQSRTVGERLCLSAYLPWITSGPTSHQGPATAPRSQQVRSKKGEKLCFPEGCLIDGQAHRGPGLLRRTLSRAVLDIRERERAATGVRRKDKSPDGPASCPWASWELQPKSSSEKAVAQTQPLPGHLHPQASDYLGRLCAPNGDIPFYTHYGGKHGEVGSGP